MLTVLPPGMQPDTAALLNGAEANPHGHGFAIVTQRELIIRHGLDAGDMVELFVALRVRNIDGAALFHSRLATHGSIGLENCHPFRLRGDERSVIAHNGVLPQSAQPGPDDDRSDTRIAADEILSLDSFATPRGRKRTARWAGWRNKITLLALDRRIDDGWCIVNEDQGLWADGSWYSNTDFRGFGSFIDDNSGFDDPGYCAPCDMAGTIDEDGVCLVCEICADCNAHRDVCLCYPAELGVSAAAG